MFYTEREKADRREVCFRLLQEQFPYGAILPNIVGVNFSVDKVLSIQFLLTGNVLKPEKRNDKRVYFASENCRNKGQIDRAFWY